MTSCSLGLANQLIGPTCAQPGSPVEPEHPSYSEAMQKSAEQLSAYAAMRVAGDVDGLEILVKNDMFGQLACAAAGISSSIPTCSSQ